MARLVAATCPKCGAGVRIDPNQQFVTCTYCGVSSFIETPKRPATQEIRHAQPVIHIERVPRSGLGCLPGIITLAVLGAVIAAVSGQFVSMFALIRGQTPGASSAGSIGFPIQLPSGFAIPAIPVPAAAEDLFADPSIVKRRFEERLGKPVMVKELVLYPSYAFAEAQDPKNKQHLDRYSYRNGAVGEPEAMQVSGGQADKVDRLVFSLDTLAFDKLAAAIQAARQKDIPLEQGKVSHVIITRDVFSRGTPVFRIYVSGPRDSGGYVEYDPNGTRRRVVR